MKKLLSSIILVSTIALPFSVRAKTFTPEEQTFSYLDMYDYAINMLNAYEDHCITDTCNPKDMKKLQKNILKAGHYAGFTSASFGHSYDIPAMKNILGQKNWTQVHSMLKDYASLSERMANQAYPQAKEKWQLILDQRPLRKAHIDANKDLSVNMRMLESVVGTYAYHHKGLFPATLDILKKELKAHHNYKLDSQSFSVDALLAQTIMKADFKLGQKSKLLYEPVLSKGLYKHYRIYAVDHEGFPLSSIYKHPYNVTNINFPAPGWRYLQQQSDMITNKNILLEKCPKSCDFMAQRKITDEFSKSSTVIIYPGETVSKHNGRFLAFNLKSIPKELKTLRQLRTRIQSQIQHIKKERFNIKKMSQAFIPKKYDNSSLAMPPKAKKK